MFLNVVMEEMKEVRPNVWKQVTIHSCEPICVMEPTKAMISTALCLYVEEVEGFEVTNITQGLVMITFKTGKNNWYLFQQPPGEKY